jgi:hypothetical protein
VSKTFTSLLLHTVKTRITQSRIVLLGNFCNSGAEHFYTVCRSTIFILSQQEYNQRRLKTLLEGTRFSRVCGQQKSRLPSNLSTSRSNKYNI